MKKKIGFMIAFAIYSSFVIGQTSSVSKIVNGPAFESLTISGPVEVELIESETPSLEILGSYDFVNGLSTRWSKKSLSLTFTKDANACNAPVKVYVKNLTSITLENGARVITPKPLHSGNILINIYGESYARIVNYGGINVYSDEDYSVKKFNYVSSQL